MNIQAFPSQDLAKLVLGYLAEEQLMTVYDEFLQASPHLDALRNEYDRIFMTSLKSILAEYRAVKIYVETCKPFALRKKMFQCSNLLEVFKFLVSNIDYNKLQSQETAEKIGEDKESINLKAKTCEICNSLSHPNNCICNINQAEAHKSDNISTSHTNESCPQNSVETTPLIDLPGNHSTVRKKHNRLLQKEDVSDKQMYISDNSLEVTEKDSNIVITSNDNSPVSYITTPRVTESFDSMQKIEEFNDVLKSVVSKNNNGSNNYTVSSASTFQAFASGVEGGCQSGSYNIPDSSTSENTGIKASLPKENNRDNDKRPKLLLQVSQATEIKSCSQKDTPKLPQLLPKPTEQKIKIISDVKVNSKYKCTRKPAVLQNAVSTPLIQMQKIIINGTPAYKHTPMLPQNHTYTKEEIMAMPTLIVMRAPAPSIVGSDEPEVVHTNDANDTQENSPRGLGPLVIDVPLDEPLTSETERPDMPDICAQKFLETGLVKTVEFKNSTAPKEGITVESNTPQVLPPTRKSSSTPRRSSHIRVLDFTTPRRIFQETINEHAPISESTSEIEVVLSSSTKMIKSLNNDNLHVNPTSEVLSVQKPNVSKDDTGSAKENDSINKLKVRNKCNWDADLRALIAIEDIESSSKASKPKATKKNVIDKSVESKKKVEKKQSSSKKKMSPKAKKTRKRRKIEHEAEEPPLDLGIKSVSVKPTINIICKDNYAKKEFQEPKIDIVVSKNKSTEDQHITPEEERLTLQNVMESKFNLSDYLETPYKQVVYEMQMETPRCLGPDLPDVPVSDIKISNIPTPRFLDTANPVLATPSSYSSRPTDYSSGGSYYKPDDQDYLPIPDLCPVTSSKEDLTVRDSIEKDSEEKKSRPVRQCTKNVSYKNMLRITKEHDESTDITYSKINTSLKNNKSSVTITPRDKSKAVTKSENKKKEDTRKIRSKEILVKEKSKSFMKIKPRYTPKKETANGRNRKIVRSPRYNSSNLHRKRTFSKEKPISPTPSKTAVPTKSRRKSSTPRKLHCTKTFNSESSGHDSPELTTNVDKTIIRDVIANVAQDSDAEQIALHWSDEGSQDTKSRDPPTNTITSEIEDIKKIQEFIDSSNAKQRNNHKNTDDSLQDNLVKRGFDVETAKIIERDLLDDAPSCSKSTVTTKGFSIDHKTLPISIDIAACKTINIDSPTLEKTLDTDSSVANELQIVQDIDDDEEIELSVYECNEESNNFISCEYDETKEVCGVSPINLKDKFTMEVCIDDELTIRLRATPFSITMDQDPLTVDEIDYSYKETEMAVNSIASMDKLYTPLKHAIKTQCYEIFDSTLTSLDTPMKAISPVRASDVSATEQCLEDKSELKDKADSKKRKRIQSGSDESGHEGKKAKQDAQCLFNSANIQNMDIESVLTKLHGP